MGVSHTTSARSLAPPATTGALENLLASEALDPRALDVLRALDWTSPEVIIWVPGTHESQMPSAIAGAFQVLMPGRPIVRLQYEQSWQMRSSVPDGSAVLGDVLRGIAALRKRGLATSRVLLAGHSQGSWVIATQIGQSANAHLVHRTVVFSNPGTNHAARLPGPGPLSTGARVDSILEISNPNDPIALPVHDVDAALDIVGSPNIFKRVFSFLKVAVRDIRYAHANIDRQLWQWLHLLDPTQDPHQYTREAIDGVRYLRDGISALSPIESGSGVWGEYR